MFNKKINTKRHKTSECSLANRYNENGELESAIIETISDTKNFFLNKINQSNGQYYYDLISEKYLNKEELCDIVPLAKFTTAENLSLIDMIMLSVIHNQKSNKKTEKADSFDIDEDNSYFDSLFTDNNSENNTLENEDNTPNQ